MNASVPAVLEDLSKAVSLSDRIDELQELMLEQAQAECPVIHRFGPGLYMREVTIPAGAIAIGHYQKREHLNVMLKGKITVLRDDGNLETLTAPLVFTGKPGRKVGYVHEEVVWQNIYATFETDVEKLEAMFLDKSQAWQDKYAAATLLCIPVIEDQEDYQELLEQLGLNDSDVRAETERTEDMIELPHGSYKVKVGDSGIQGKGLRATAAIAAEEWIAPARIGDKRTIAGRYTNHSKRPNARPERVGNEIWLVASLPIAGCLGGWDGEEITIDYRESVRIALEMREENKCQESPQP